MQTSQQYNQQEVRKMEEIADAFFKHFKHYGYKKTAVDEVAEELKISKKTIYTYFRSKEEIFHFVVNRLANSKLQEFSAQIEDIPTYCGKIQALVEMMFSHKRMVQKKKGRIKDKHEREVIVAAFKNAFYDLERSLIVNGKECGEFNVEDVDLATRYVQSVIGAGIEEMESDPDKMVEIQIKEAICKLLK